MSKEQNGGAKGHPKNSSNKDTSLVKIDSLSCKLGEELEKLLEQIRNCRKTCQNTTQLVGTIYDSIK